MFTDNKPKGFFENFSSKTSFFLGLIGGILVICAVGFFVILGVTLSNSEDDNNSAANNQNKNTALEQPNQPDNLPSEPQLSNIEQVSSKDHLRGDLNAPIMIVEFSDFQCPYCDMVHPVLDRLVEEYKGKVAWVYRHLPLDQLHPYAQKASEASECAADQGKFWEYSDKLYENQKLINNDYFSQLAGELKLNQGNFDDCLSSGKYTQKVKDQKNEAITAGLTGTPGLFVNDQFVRGALPYDNFKQLIDSLLSQ
ncbi:DsbA family protein [Patescibacteria group bacterium]|nr:DsbA family protein [Patescibacteria group bacterium]